jgi:hypothetical protein
MAEQHVIIETEGSGAIPSSSNTEVTEVAHRQEIEIESVEQVDRLLPREQTLLDEICKK